MQTGRWQFSSSINLSSVYPFDGQSGQASVTSTISCIGVGGLAADRLATGGSKDMNAANLCILDTILWTRFVHTPCIL